MPLWCCTWERPSVRLTFLDFSLRKNRQIIDTFRAVSRSANSRRMWFGTWCLFRLMRNHSGVPSSEWLNMRSGRESKRTPQHNIAQLVVKQILRWVCQKTVKDPSSSTHSVIAGHSWVKLLLFLFTNRKLEKIFPSACCLNGSMLLEWVTLHYSVVSFEIKCVGERTKQGVSERWPQVTSLPNRISNRKNHWVYCPAEQDGCFIFQEWRTLRVQRKEPRSESRTRFTHLQDDRKITKPSVSQSGKIVVVGNRKVKCCEISWKASAWYSRVLSESNCVRFAFKVEGVIERAMETMLPSKPPDVESLRVYLTMPYCHMFDDPSNYRMVICPFAKSLVSLEATPFKVLGE